MLSGQLFWKDEKAYTEAEFGVEEETDAEMEEVEAPVTETISNKLIRKIVQEKRDKKYLAEDMKNMKENFKFISKFVKNEDDRTIQKVTNVLINHHYLFYYIFLHGMEKAQEGYCEKDNKIEYSLLQEYLHHFTDKYEGIIT